MLEIISVYWTNDAGYLTSVSDIYATDTEVAAATTTLKANLAPVARTGVYSDLTGKPTALSVFTNDMGYLTSIGNNIATDAKVAAATTTLKATVDSEYTKTANLDATFATDAQVASSTTNLKSVIDNQIELATTTLKASLAPVATSGAYADLTGKPTALSVFTNDMGYLTSIGNNIATDAKVAAATTTLKATVDSEYTKTANLDATFATDAQVASSTTNLKSVIDSQIINATTTLKSIIDSAVAAEYLTQSSATVNYATKQDLAGISGGTAVNTNNLGWVPAASYALKTDIATSTTTLKATVDSEYTKTANLDATFATDAEVANSTTNLKSVIDSQIINATTTLKSSLAPVATSGAYADLTGKPTNISAFINDAGYLTAIGDNIATDAKVANATTTLKSTIESDISTINNGLQNQINNITTSTGSIKSSLDAVVLSTGAINSSLNSEITNRANADSALAISTGTIKSSLDSAILSTESILAQISNITVSTQSFQSQITNITASTGTIKSSLDSVILSTGSLQTQSK